MWSPLPLEELHSYIIEAESRLPGNAVRLWKLISIKPEKWQEKKYGEEGGGFWVVAIFGHRVMWYNDIEEGFNISCYHQYGLIDEYWCDQLTLHEAIVTMMHNLVA